ncbi:MAG: hypothetical protein ACO3C1_10055, partial [Ilumatobacteraceae bacterium]
QVDQAHVETAAGGAAVGAALAAMTMAVVAGVDSAEATPSAVSQAVRVPARVEIDMVDSTCDNTGSTIDISGSMTLFGESVRVIFKNNVKGTHTVQVVDQLDVEVTPFDEDLSFPKQPVRGGVGGNPWIAVQLESGGASLTPPIVVGRCVQGTSSHIGKDILLPADMAMLLTALDCSNKGSSLALDLSSEDAGLDAVLLFDNNRNKVVHRYEAAADVTVSLTGERTIRKGGGASGAGGNPLVYAQFVDGTGQALSSEMFLGRCNKLGA